MAGSGSKGARRGRAMLRTALTTATGLATALAAQAASAQTTQTAPGATPPVAPEQATPSSQSPAQQASPDVSGQSKPSNTTTPIAPGGSAQPGQPAAKATSLPGKARYYKGRGPGRSTDHFDRNEDDFSYLIDPSKKKDAFDGLKHINLNDSGDVYLTLNGEARLRLDAVAHKNLGVANGRTAAGVYTFSVNSDDQRIGYTRLELGAALNVQDWMTLYVEAGNGQEFGHNYGTVKPGVQSAQLTLPQAYVEFRNVDHPLHYGVRVGRQFIYLGNGLQIAPNYSTSFPIPTYDAVRGYLDYGSWRVDGFYGRVIQYVGGVLNSYEDHGDTNWGAYGSYDLKPFKLGGATAKTTIEPFWIGYKDVPSATLNRGAYYDSVFVTGPISSKPFSGITPPSTDVRDTFGLRYFGSVGNFDFDWQGGYQIGQYGDYDVQAFAINTETGYTLPGSWKPRIAVRANVASGGANGSSHVLRTYNPMWSALFYYAENTVISPANIWNLAPRFTFAPLKNVKGTIYDSIFWRYSRDDALYSGLWQGGGGPNSYATTIYNRRTFVGHQPSIRFDWAANDHLSFTLLAADFLAGPAIKEAGGQNTTYFRFIADAKF